MSRIGFKVIPIPMLSDNYGYLLIDKRTGIAATVDCVKPKKALEIAKDLQISIKYILTTHSHWDHAGGNTEMAKATGVPVVAGADDGAEACTLPVEHGNRLVLGTDTQITVLATPCHTPGHVSYFVTNKTRPERCVFTGDTMFIGGCGNLNSGTPSQMFHALVEVLGSLPDDTQVFVGHNYTAKNLRFAQYVEPENTAISQKLKEAEEKDERNEFIHSTIGGEKAYNPFMRVGRIQVQEWARTTSLLPKMSQNSLSDPVQTLAKVRLAKDIWGRRN